MDLKVVLYYVLRVHVKQREAVNTLVKFFLVCLLREGQNRWKGSTANLAPLKEECYMILSKPLSL